MSATTSAFSTAFNLASKLYNNPTAREIGTSLFQHAVGDSISLGAKKAAQNTAAETTKKAAKEAVKDTIQETAHKAVEEAAQSEGASGLAGKLFGMAKQAEAFFTSGLGQQIVSGINPEIGELLKAGAKAKENFASSKGASGFLNSDTLKKLVTYVKDLFKKGETKNVKEFFTSLAKNSDEIIGNIAKILGIKPDGIKTAFETVKQLFGKKAATA